MTERPDRVSAALTARLQGSRVLISGETTESSLTYANPDSTFTTEATSGVVRVKQGDRWAPVDTTLVEADGVLRPRAATAGVEFSAGGGDRPLAKMTREDGKSFALEWPAPLPKPRLKGNQAVFPDAVGSGADLVVTALPAGFRHDVVLRERPAGPVEFKLPVRTEGLKLAVTKQGGLLLTDVKGRQVAGAPEPVAYDTAPAPGQGAVRPAPAEAQAVGEIDTRVITENGRQTLVLKPDQAFLNDPDTRYPVTVDPTTTLTTLNDFTIYSDAPNATSDGVGVGTVYTAGQTTPGHTRALLGFDTSSLNGQVVTDARLELHGNGGWGCVTGQNVRAQRITSAWSYVGWGTQPTTTTSGQQVGVEPGQCSTTTGVPTGIWAWPITDIAKAWAGGAGGHGIMLRLVTENNEGYARDFDYIESTEPGAVPAKLIVTYGSTPSIGQVRAAPIASYGATVYTATTTPSLFADTNDPDGGVLRAEYEVERDPDAGQGTGPLWSGSVEGVQAGAVAKITVPTGEIADGDKVRWRARAYDGTSYSAWSAWQKLAADATLPPAPGVNCANAAANSWNTFSGSQITCFLSTTAADVISFHWGLDAPSAPNIAVENRGEGEYLTAQSIDLTPTDGWHTLHVKVRDKAHHTSPVATYSFGIGPGGIVTPKDMTRTQRTVTLAAAAPAARTQARYEYRSDSSSSQWTPIPTADVTPAGSAQPITSWPQTRTDTAQNFPDLTWDLSKTLRTANPKDGSAELRACFIGGSAEACSEPVTVILDQSAFGGSYATTDIGPGQVALQTGDFSLKATDASLFGVGVGRTLTTLNPGKDREDEQLVENKVFGPGWRAGFPAAPSGIADFYPSDMSASGKIQLIGSSGETLTYLRSGQEFAGTGDAADGSRITVDTDQLIVTGSDGSKTTYTRPNGQWVVTRAETAAAESAVTYLRDTQGRVTRVLAPVSAGVTCGATLVAGCRALELTYATATTATGVASGWGDYTGQVKQVSVTAFDPATNAMKTTVLASYAYDTTGYLRQVTDPRTGLAVTYYYNGEGRLSQLTPPGLAPWRMEYDSTGRLAHVQREGGTVDPTWAVAYDVPIGGTGAPVDLTLTQTAKWGQNTDLLTTGTAIFPASHLPPRGGTGAYQPAAGDWEYGQLIYSDVNGRPVNTAVYGAGAWQITSGRYDDKGNPVWQLSAGSRAQALAPTVDTDPYTTGRTDSAERANLLAIVSTYSADRDVLSLQGPAHLVTLTNGTTVSARQHTAMTYDEGKPVSGRDYHLVTTVKVGPVVLDGFATPAAADVRVTKTGYDPIASGDRSGWEIHRATSQTIVMPGQSDLVKKARYDASGREIERRTPASSGNDAGTTVASYYTAGAHPSVGACGNKPQWAGLTCQTAPAAQPLGKPLPVTTTTYGYYGTQAEVIEKAGTTVRNSITTYDGAARPTKVTLTVTPPSEGGVGIPEKNFVYDPATGLRTQVTAGGASVGDGYDSLGRIVSTTDADGNTTVITYTLDGQISTFNDGKGTNTFTYGGFDAAGRVERRDLPTKVDTGSAGVFKGAYDADGQTVLETYPNGLIASRRYNNTGKQTGLTYGKGATNWLTFSQTSDGFGRVTSSGNGSGSLQKYSYDGAGRLSKVLDTYQGSCTTRLYGFDLSSNRTSLVAHGAGTDGACSDSTPSTTKNSTFDAANRIVDAGYVYDAFGRTAKVPAGQVSGTGELQATYHANDMMASLDQGGQQKSFTIDPLDRIRSTITVGGSQPGTTVNHYSSREDSPSWISEADGTWTRNIISFSGLAAIQKSNGTSTIQIVNIHGDIVATCENITSATGISTYHEQTEYGVSRPENTNNPSRYAWHGADQRSQDALADTILMGARLYNPSSGRFLQVDPVIGGGENAYSYPTDPVNGQDLDGKCWGYEVGLYGFEYCYITYSDHPYHLLIGAIMKLAVAITGLYYAGKSVKSLIGSFKDVLKNPGRVIDVAKKVRDACLKDNKSLGACGAAGADLLGIRNDFDSFIKYAEYWRDYKNALTETERCNVIAKYAGTAGPLYGRRCK